MTEEHENALAIAEIRGEVKAIRSEYAPMESRIDTKLTALGGAIDKQQAELLAEIAKRETRLLLSIAVMLTLAVSLMGLIVLWPVS